VRLLAQTSKQANISSPRFCIALGLCVSIAAAQVWQAVSKRDDWPLSSYPMYSELQSRVIQRYTLAGVTAEGEVELTSDYTSPWTRGRLRKLLTGDFRDAAPQLITATCENLRELKAADISALRLYKNDWEMNSELEGMNERGKLRGVVPMLCPQTREAILAQQQAGPAKATTAPSGSLLFEAEELQLSGNVTMVEEPNASKGKAVRLSGTENPEKPTASPGTSLRVEFDLAPGSYHVWLRVKAEVNASEASVWLQVNDEIGTKRGTAYTKLNKPVSEYPDAAFAWVSKKPGYPPAAIELSGSGKHRLLVSIREASPVVDQIVLTTAWPEQPAHNLPLTP
jgi:hypothetical protein